MSGMEYGDETGDLIPSKEAENVARAWLGLESQPDGASSSSIPPAETALPIGQPARLGLGAQLKHKSNSKRNMDDLPKALTDIAKRKRQRTNSSAPQQTSKAADPDQQRSWKQISREEEEEEEDDDDDDDDERKVKAVERKNAKGLQASTEQQSAARGLNHKEQLLQADKATNHKRKARRRKKQKKRRKRANESA